VCLSCVTGTIQQPVRVRNRGRLEHDKNRSGRQGRAGCIFTLQRESIEIIMRNVKVMLLVFCAALGGCYTRQPLETIPPEPNVRVVALLTDSGTVAMSNAIGAGALEVEGVVARASQTEWTFAMMRVDHRDGRSISWNHELVTFPAATLSKPMVVALNKKKSWLAAAGITVGAFLVASAFGVINAGEDDGAEEQPQVTRVGRSVR
jgi:hypothetical protein